MDKMIEMNSKAQELFNAYNAKINEIQPKITKIERQLKGKEFESTEYAVLCAMLGGLIAARDKDYRDHIAAMNDLSPEWDGD